MTDGNPQPTGPSEAPPSVAFSVSRLGFEVSRALADGLKPLGIDPQHFGLLRALLFSEGESQRAIGDSLGIPPNRMVALVDDLEGLGAVKRAKHPTDRRAYALFLTPKGKKLFEGAFEVALSLEERLCENISKSDREQLLDLLGQLNSLTDVPGGVHPGLSR
ncbi:MAG TPA: MarR family winged helix-turn-helix transcriptional regulator [Acidimicrobiales bacterium]|jgi:DNA-binding MarR family transcriptional regulator|nr:MarR family winged helix-turn-helix transcriptional regulator [Acidimicrobiales bacterium]